MYVCIIGHINPVVTPSTSSKLQSIFNNQGKLWCGGIYCDGDDDDDDCSNNGDNDYANGGGGDDDDVDDLWCLWSDQFIADHDDDDDDKDIVNDNTKDTAAIPTSDDDYQAHVGGVDDNGDDNGAEDQNPLMLLKQHRVNEFLLSLLGKIVWYDWLIDW